MNEIQASPPSPPTEIDVASLLKYRTDARGGQHVLNTVANFETILENDTRFKDKIGFNQFDNNIHLRSPTIWAADAPRPWKNCDDSAAFGIIQNDFGLTSRQDYNDSLINVAHRNPFHPVREWLEGLIWDGEEHIRRLLPDYLGTEDSEYNYIVMKTQMDAAVARVVEPAIKFDTCLILKSTRQGIGKSTFIANLAVNRGWYTDSIESLDNTAAESLLGKWIIELGELSFFQKTAGGIEAIKRFITTQQDRVRLPYLKRSEDYPRQCVFFATTNKQDFLIDTTGNRRFVVIECDVNPPTKSVFDDMSADVAQAWAEAFYIWTTEHPKLILPQWCVEQAEQMQEAAQSDDGTHGIVTEYIKDKTQVCAVQLWQEALGEQGRPPRWKASELNDLLAKLPDWERMKSPTKFGKFGNQRGFKRKNSDDGFITVSDEDLQDLPFE